jgi:DNA-binding response OmpR family regulator
VRGAEIDVLLVGAEWQPRALVRAQLLEEGVSAEAVEGWEDAEAALLRRSILPRVVVFDLAGESRPAAALATLQRLLGSSRVIVLCSAGTLSARDVHDAGFAHAIARPYQVKDVVARVRSLLGGPATSP